MIEAALRLEPFHSVDYLRNLHRAYRLAGRYQDAVAAARKMQARAPGNYTSSYYLAITYSLMGQMEHARESAEEALRLRPDFSVETFRKASPYTDSEITNRYADALRAAGIPDKPTDAP